ncbi:MAG: hypothetical protein JSV86_12270 [Gemmatimonadota bacterium]|nr:MAG: hypothetical protein JSV86_12270 [Gemmatimonadota bacterium]
MKYRRPVGALLVAALLAAVGAWGWSMYPEDFPHQTHASLFSSCDGCHSVDPAGVSFPEPGLCQGCHNGQMAREVAWEGPSRRANKFGFNHAEVIQTKQELGEDVSCADCHMAGEGPMDVGRAPASHTPFFLDDHRAYAAAATAECETCHIRDQRCYGCHTGSENLDVPGEEQARYHPNDFQEQHSAAAWSRETECSSCHNTEAYCRACHLSLGRGTEGFTTTHGYHNWNTNFSTGHGQAARQGLESCATCHAQQDCLQCHSAKGQFKVNPHGADFNAERLRDKNPELCLFCHNSSILDSPL